MKDQAEPFKLTIKYASQAYGISRSELYRLLAAGLITAQKSGRSTLIDGDSLRAYVASLPKASFRAPATKAAA